MTPGKMPRSMDEMAARIAQNGGALTNAQGMPIPPVPIVYGGQKWACEKHGEIPNAAEGVPQAVKIQIGADDQVTYHCAACLKEKQEDEARAMALKIRAEITTLTPVPAVA